MPRGPRKQSSSGIYHVVIKGIDNRIIFAESRDYKKFLNILESYKEECHFKIYAYCLMSNHVHLLLQVTDFDISTILQKINTKYALWFNMKYQRHGYLFGGRFHSETVEDQKFLFNVIRYIHFNPTKAKLESAPGVSYSWSSYCDYSAKRSNLVDINEIISEFNGYDNFYDFHSKKNHFAALDIDSMRCQMPDDVAGEIIQDITGCSTIEEFQVLPDKRITKDLKLLHKKGLSIRQLNRLTGLSKGQIEHRLKN